MSLFDKCEAFTLARDFRAKGIYPYFHYLESRQDTEVIMEGKRRIMLGSNNYLGLTVHPEVQEAAVGAAKEYGTGCSGSRFLNGTLKMHLELEEALAAQRITVQQYESTQLHCKALIRYLQEHTDSFLQYCRNAYFELKQLMP